ncbi:Voltage-gated hydrogen channel 1 [Cladochytrium tenue]|nr:Voltage-gated hydrogen channel 1 [Cladochytrium tenue]
MPAATTTAAVAADGDVDAAPVSTSMPAVAVRDDVHPAVHLSSKSTHDSPRHGDDAAGRSSSSTHSRTHHPHHQPARFSREWLAHLLHNDAFHRIIIGLVLFDLVLVFLDLILAVSSSCTPESEAAGAYLTCKPNLRESDSLTIAEAALFWMSVVLLCGFAVEVLLSVYARGIRHLFSFVMAADAVVVYMSLFLELYFHFKNDEETGVGALVILRIWKLVRAMHAISHSLEMKAKAIIAEIRASNHAISSACLTTAAAFDAGKTDFLAGSRAAAADFASARRAAAVARSNSLDADANAAAARLVSDADAFFARVEAALRDLKRTVARENQRHLESTLDAADTDEDGEGGDADEGREVKDVSSVDKDGDAGGAEEGRLAAFRVATTDSAASTLLPA